PNTPTIYTYTLYLHDALPILKSKKAELASSTQKNYIYGMVLIGLSLLNDSYAYEKEIPLEQQAEKFAEKVSPILIPMIDSLGSRSEEHTSELQSRFDLVCRLL